MHILVIMPRWVGDVVMATGEWSFISALGHNVLFALRNGITGTILEGRAHPDAVLEAVGKFRVTLIYSVATVYRRILAIDGAGGQRDGGADGTGHAGFGECQHRLVPPGSFLAASRPRDPRSAPALVASLVPGAGNFKRRSR